MKKQIKKSISKSAVFLLTAALLFPSVILDISASTKTLIPLGQTIGIKMFSGGAMIVGFASPEAAGGESPAEGCGLKIGDVIEGVDGKPVGCNEELSKILSLKKSDGAVFSVRRGDAELEITVNGLIPLDGGGYRLGAWVRDSMAGIGTVTYVDPGTGEFGALGHGVCDIDTGELMPFNNGSTMSSNVVGIFKGRKGEPGLLRGEFDLKKDNGILYRNTEKGIFGKLTDEEMYSGLEAYEIAAINEVKCGRAEIISNIEGSSKCHYEAKITEIIDKEAKTKNFIIEVTDKRLIEKTGGIVQGMSGSPIIQDGKLVGAVTHVLVNDPTRGYGIFIENMLDAAG